MWTARRATAVLLSSRLTLFVAPPGRELSGVSVPQHFKAIPSQIIGEFTLLFIYTAAQPLLTQRSHNTPAHVTPGVAVIQEELETAHEDARHKGFYVD